MQPQICGLCPLSRTVDAAAFQFVPGISQACRVQQRDRKPFQVQTQFNDVARRSGDVRHKGHFAFGDPVDQAGFSGIGGADDGNLEAIADAFRRRIASDLHFQFSLEHIKQLEDLARNLLWNLLIGEIDAALDQGTCADQQRSPSIRLPRQFAIAHPQGGKTLRFGLCGQKITQSLHLGQIHLPVQEGAFRELSGFGQPQTLRLQKLPQTSDDHGGTMKVDFHHVLAREAVAGFEPHHKGAVQDVLAIGDLAQIGMARLRQRACQSLGHGPRARSADANNGNATPPRRGGFGKDQVHGSPVRRSSNRRIPCWIWSASVSRSGTRSRPSCPSGSGCGAADRSFADPSNRPAVLPFASRT